MIRRVIGWTSAGAVWVSVWGSPIEWLKNSLMFHPNAVVETSPAAFELPYEDVWFGGPDGRSLHGWYIPGPGKAPGAREEPTVHQSAIPNPQSALSPEPLLLWFHGNAGNIGHRLAQLRLLYTRIAGSHFLFDYRGYGKSRGRPTSMGILADGRDAVALAVARGWTAGRQIVYFGESLGCAVAVALAVEQSPDRVILSAPFYSLRAMGNLVLPPLAFLVGEDFNSARLIERLQSPLLVIHGTMDDTVPFQQGQDLYALAPHPKRFYAVPGAGHTDMHEVGGETYVQIIKDFLAGQML